MSDAELFSVILDGDYVAGVEPSVAHEQFARLARYDVSQVAQLIRSSPVMVKSGLTWSDAHRYMTAIKRTGLSCVIESDGAAEKKVMTCPKCGASQAEGNIDCRSCGIVFHKYQSSLVSPICDVEVETAEDDELYALRGISGHGRRALLIGAVAAFVVLMMPYVSFILGAFSTLVHEFGHALFAWVFGYPSIPAFDFVYGGGVAIHFERANVILWAVYAFSAWLLVRYHKRGGTVVLLLGAIALYSLLAFTTAHQVLLLFMGHGTELAFASLFLFRAISGHATFHETERVLYGFIGFLLQFRALQFVYDFFYDPVFRDFYQQGKGGLTNDFQRIAWLMNVEMTTVFSFFFVCALLPPLLAWMAYRYESYWFPALRRLFIRELDRDRATG